MLIIPIILLLVGLFLYLSREPKSEWHKYLERRLERYPDYINWLKYANGGRDYKKGLKILKRIERDNNNSYKRWFKKIRKMVKGVKL